MSKEHMTGSQSAIRALDLLEALTLDGGQAPAREIIARLDLSSATGRRLVALLVERGLLTRTSHGRYAGGAKIRQLSAYVSPHARLIETARPILRQLAQAERATAYLGVFEGEMVTYLVKEGAQTGFTREQQQLEAYCTGIGKVLLAQLEQDRLADYLSVPLVRLTAKTIVDPERLRAELIDTKARGYAVDDREMAEDLRCVAVPLPKLRGSAYAISLSSSSARFARRKAAAISEALAQAAEEITAHFAA
jgi:IclR family transcriptional regulator, acetate operon repressor